MTPPDIVDLFAVMEATWPAVRVIDLPGWQLRDGAGGGQRVSAATATTSAPSVSAMEAAQDALGQPPLVMIRPWDAALDAELEALGYRIQAPVCIYLARVDDMAKAPPPVSAFLVNWPPVEIQVELWAEGGIGPERLAVMERATGPKCAILGRIKDQPAGTAFVAAAGSVAVLHALEVTPRLRRGGTACNMMHGAALWAQAQGAEWMAVLVTEDNVPANALYSSLGMQPVGRYHYRAK